MKTHDNFTIDPFQHFAHMAVNPEYKKVIDSVVLSDEIDTRVKENNNNHVLFNLAYLTLDLIGK